IAIKEIRVDGGATVNNLLMQFQSDVLNCKVVRPKITETTAAGAAYLAGLAIGFWKDISEIEKYWKEERTFAPAAQNETVKKQIKKWHTAIKAAQIWSEVEAG
ncbi:MAG: FGGY-family carbohydrate kinase, partial [Flavisolibacter sp.]